MAKKSGNSSSALQEKALDLIGSRDSGLFQSELRRLLSVDSSRCSKIVSRLRGLGLICREKVPASSTYLLKLARPPARLDCPLPHISHIDSYLTEIYLLYLTRGISG
jgi:hypothetical protein